MTDQEKQELREFLKDMHLRAVQSGKAETSGLVLDLKKKLEQIQEERTPRFRVYLAIVIGIAGIVTSIATPILYVGSIKTEVAVSSSEIKNMKDDIKDIKNSLLSLVGFNRTSQQLQTKLQQQ